MSIRFFATPQSCSFRGLCLSALCAWSLGVVGCAPGAEREVVPFVDLVEEFRYAEVVAERPLIDFGRADEPFLGEGWSFAEEGADGTTFAWGLGQRSEVEVFLVWARELDVQMRCRSYGFDGAPPQSVTVLWDGEEAARVGLAERFTEPSFRLAGNRAAPGWHRLTLLPAWSAVPAEQAFRDPPSRDRRDLSIACDWIRIGADAVVEQAHGEGDTLWIPVSSSVSFYLEPERPSALVWRDLSLRGGSRLEISWEVEGEERVSASVAERDGARVALPMPRSGVGERGEEWGVVRPARLTLRATRDERSPDEGEAGVVLRSPVLARAATESPVVAAIPAEQGLAAVPGATPTGGPPSIVLWIVDTLRVDRLGLYGFERPVSPNYDALAEQSTVFEAATAQSAWTRPTVATLLTGLSPLRHGITRLEHGLGDEWKLLPERLRELGYATACFSANLHVQRDTGFDQGFDEFRYGFQATAETLVGQALAWLDSVRTESPDRPVFIMILSIEPHESYEPAEPFRRRFAPDVVDRRLGTWQYMAALDDKRESADPDIVRQLFQLYEAEIAWGDHVFGEFRQELGRRDLRPAIVVVADHGEAFAERGLFGHEDLHREVLHIPFFVHLPGQTEGSRVGLPVQQADVLPTLVDLAGGELGGDIAGRSLLPMLSPVGSDGPASALAEVLRSRPIVSVHGRLLYSLVRGRWKLIEERRRGQASIVQLFDRVGDPEELVDLAGERPILARRLLRVLQEEVELEESGAVDSAEVTLDDEARRQLEAMGYIE